MARELERTLSAVRMIDRASSAEEACEVLLTVAQPLGFDWILAGTMPEASEGPARQAAHVLLARWP